MERTYTEINEKIGLLLASLAKENGFVREERVFISTTGKRFMPCKLGFVEVEQYRDKVNIERLTDELISLANENKRLKTTIERQGKAISKDKNILKVCNILSSNQSNEETIKQLKRYLNI